MIALILTLVGTIGTASPPPCPVGLDDPSGADVAGIDAWSGVGADAAADDPVARRAAGAGIRGDVEHPHVEANARDGLLGEDKLAHAAASFALTTSLHASARTVGASREPALAVGAGLAAVAGLAKELYDRRRGGALDPADLAWNAVGIAAGLLLLTQIR